MNASQGFLTAALGFSVVLLKVSTGLSSKAGHFVHLLEQPRLLSKAFLAINVIPAAAAIAIAYWLPLELAAKGGIVLMGVSAVQPIAPGKVLGLTGRKEFAHGIYVAMSLLAIVMVPAGLAIAAAVFGRDERVSVLVVAEKIVGGVLVPLLIGTGIQRLAPAWAARALPWVTRLGLLLLVLGFGATVVTQWPAIARLLGNGTLLAMLAVLGVALVGGHLLGGPERQDRATLAIASASRHPGIAILIIGGSGLATPSVEAAVVLFALMGVLVGVAYKLWFQRGHVTATA